jgi:prepilin-type N-terminal cleavage/methylation domain-containing protein
MYRAAAAESEIRVRDGFSLLEVVIVTAIIAVLAAISIPRMSRGSRGAADSSLSGDLAVLRKAIDLYSAEHGGLLPTGDGIKGQLTKYSDIAGLTNESKVLPFVYGPYLRSIPPLPVGVRKGQSGIKNKNSGDVGWIYDEASGTIKANSTPTEKDDAGRLYSDY